MGDAMEVSYAVLSSFAAGLQDGLHFLIEVEAWSSKYEEANMVPALTNKNPAESHFEIVCMNVPAGSLGPSKELISVLLGERLRRAMMRVRQHCQLNVADLVIGILNHLGRIASLSLVSYWYES